MLTGTLKNSPETHTIFFSLPLPPYSSNFRTGHYKFVPMFITFRSNPSIYFWFFPLLSLPRTISGSLPFCILFILFSIQLLFYLRLLYVQVVLIQLLLEMSRSVHLTVRLKTEASAHRTPTSTRNSENFTTHIN